MGVLFAGTLAQLVVWRMLGGLGIAPTHIRGRLVTRYQLSIVLGIFSALLVNMLIQRGGDDAWNIASG